MTGGGDGIGEAICYELAKSGFNIIIISRTLEKMRKVESNLKNLYNIQVKTYVFDFNKLSNEIEVYELYKILDSISEEVVILVNNVGVGRIDALDKISIEETLR